MWSVSHLSEAKDYDNYYFITSTTSTSIIMEMDLKAN